MSDHVTTAGKTVRIVSKQDGGPLGTILVDTNGKTYRATRNGREIAEFNLASASDEMHPEEPASAEDSEKAAEVRRLMADGFSEEEANELVDTEPAADETTEETAEPETSEETPADDGTAEGDVDSGDGEPAQG